MRNAPETIGQRLKRAREHAKLTQDGLGALIGVKGPTVSKYESDYVAPGLASLPIISQIAHTTVEWLITGAGPGPGETNYNAVVETPPLVNEQQAGFGRAATRDEGYLLRTFRKLAYTDQQAILNHADALAIAYESRVIDGGGSDSLEANSD